MPTVTVSDKGQVVIPAEITDRRFNRMRPSIAPRKRHQAG